MVGPRRRAAIAAAGAALAVIAAHGTRAAAGPQLSPVTSTDYAIDLYQGVAFGATEVVGMGGAAVALAQGSSGTLINPAASAVRSPTDHDSWSWDYHFDVLSAALSGDYTNSGLPVDSGGVSTVTGGLALRVGNWGGAVTITQSDTEIPAATGSPALRASTLHGQLAVARWLPRWDLSIGAVVQLAAFELAPDCSGCANLFAVQGGGVAIGATWIPSGEDFRIGASLDSPIGGGQVTVQGCDPASCDGYILPDRIVVPWRVAAGAAYRFGESPWNQQVPGAFRDEHEVTIAADLVIAGSSSDAFGLGAFAQKELERSGEHTAISPRAGVEYEWLPGRLRVRGGSYWEPGRFEGVPGRAHATFGIEVRALEFWFWGGLRRGKLSLTGDVASLYKNVGLSIGFWH